jgi:hypothetical protein
MLETNSVTEVGGSAAFETEIENLEMDLEVAERNETIYKSTVEQLRRDLNSAKRTSG